MSSPNTTQLPERLNPSNVSQEFASLANQDPEQAAECSLTEFREARDENGAVTNRVEGTPRRSSDDDESKPANQRQALAPPPLYMSDSEDEDESATRGTVRHEPGCSATSPQRWDKVTRCFGAFALACLVLGIGSTLLATVLEDGTTAKTVWLVGPLLVGLSIIVGAKTFGRMRHARRNAPTVHRVFLREVLTRGDPWAGNGNQTRSNSIIDLYNSILVHIANSQRQASCPSPARASMAPPSYYSSHAHGSCNYQPLIDTCQGPPSYEETVQATAASTSPMLAGQTTCTPTPPGSNTPTASTTTPTTPTSPSTTPTSPSTTTTSTTPTSPSTTTSPSPATSESPTPSIPSSTSPASTSTSPISPATTSATP